MLDLHQKLPNTWHEMLRSAQRKPRASSPQAQTEDPQWFVSSSFALFALALPLLAASAAGALPAQYPPNTVVSVSPATAPPGGVLGTSTGNGGSTAGTGLARTGVNLEPFVLVGGLLILVGAFALVSSGRLRRRGPQLA